MLQKHNVQNLKYFKDDSKHMFQILDVQNLKNMTIFRNMAFKP